MRAFTVRRPMGDCIIHGPKRIENRTRTLGARPGEWLGVHQGRSPFAEAGRSSATIRHPVLVDRFWAWMDKQWPEYAARPVKGLEGLLGAALVERVAPYSELYLNPWAMPEHDHCIVFSRVVALEEPLAAKGALGLWTLPPHLDQALARAIALDDRRIAGELGRTG